MRRTGALSGALLLMLPAILGAAEERADFLIVPNPGRLSLYDQFQHRMSEREKKALPRGIPFRVVDARALLGDGIIPCVRAEFAGTSFFLERESQASLATFSRAVGATLIENASIRSDTVNLRRQLDLTDSEGRQFPLSAGDRLLLVLESGGRMYVETLVGTPRCGWVSLLNEERGTVWVPEESAGASRFRSASEVQRRITPIVNKTNRLFLLLAREFSRASGRKFTPPALQMATRPDAITLRISGSPQAENVRGTVRALKARIQAELPGLSVDEDLLQSSLTVSGW
jgi:hypothetical protein